MLFAGAARAQNTVTGAFQGDVSSRTGEIITAAAVEITNEQTGVTYNLTTDSKGRFYQGLLAPGFYTIRVTGSGYRPQFLRREIKISLTGDVVPVPVRLEPETAATAGTAPPVTAEEADDIRVEINTTDARRDGSSREEELEKLPLGATTVTRSFDELALLLPGVAPPPQTIGDVAGPGVGSAGQFAVNGLRSRANNFTVDGSDNNDENIGVRRQGFVALVPQPIESIQEFQVITWLSPAQFGRNIGAQVNAVSKSGGSELHGTLSATFNSNRLNSRNFFDTANGNAVFSLRTAAGQPVLLDGQPLTVRNQSAGEDSFTFFQEGGTLGGAILARRLFYFVSGEFQKINATKEKNFVVPTIEQRGAFGTGATGTFRNPFTNAPVSAIPSTLQGSALFSLFPFPNNPGGIYGANTFTQLLPASGEGKVLSAKLDHIFHFLGRQSVTGRYNFTNDSRYIPTVNEAVFSALLSKIQTHNFSFFLNSQLSDSFSTKPIFNQIRLSFGQTHLNFEEVRNGEFLIPSDEFPDAPFLLNAPLRLNVTAPTAGQPNTGAVLYRSAFAPIEGQRGTTTESINGFIGQAIVAGFSPLGVDVYNFPQRRVNNTYQFADELTRRLKKHSFVFGIDTRRTDLNSDLPRLARPLVTFNGTPRLVFENGAFRFPTANDPNPIIRPEDLVSLGAASNFLVTFNVDRPDSKAALRFYQFNIYGQDAWRISPKLSLSYGLRYEYNTPVSEVNRLIERTFTDERLRFAPGLQQFIGGRTRLYEPDGNNFAPRLGVSYSPNLFGTTRTSVFRVGYGIFYDQILGAVVSQSRNVFPTFLTTNFGGINVIGESFLGYLNPTRPERGVSTPTGEFISLRAPGTINTLNPAINFTDLFDYLRTFFPNAINATLPSANLKMPMAHHYSFVYEQQLNSHYTVSIGYIGTSAENLLRFTTPNLGPSLTVAPTGQQIFPVQTETGLIPFPISRGLLYNQIRPIRGVGAVNQFETTASSNYNSLQTEFRGRFLKGLNFQISYVLSKATDDVSDVFDLAGAFVLPQNSLTFAGERAAANFDTRHRFTYNAAYDFSNLSGGNKLLHRLTTDLQIAATGRFQTGQPFTVNSTIDVNLDGNLTDRLDTTDGIIITGDRRQPLRLATANPFSLLAPFGQDGQIKRNNFRAGNVLELDLSVRKSFSFNNQRLVWRTDFFNFVNRAKHLSNES